MLVPAWCSWQASGKRRAHTSKLLRALPPCTSAVRGWGSLRWEHMRVMMQETFGWFIVWLIWCAALMHCM